MKVSTPMAQDDLAKTLPSSQKLQGSKHIRRFSPGAQGRLIKEYQDAIGLGAGADFSAGALDALEKSRFKDLSDFKLDTATPGLEKIDATGKAQIKAALQVTPTFIEKQKEYESSVRNFKTLISQVPQSHRAQDLIETMKQITDDAIEAIKEQQKAERAGLERILDNPNFQKETSMAQESKGLGEGTDEEPEKEEEKSPAEMTAIKTQMLEALDKSHKDQLKAFEKSTSESLKTLTTAAEKELKRMLFIANLHKNTQTEAEIKQESAKKRGQRPSVVEVGLTDQGVYILGVQVEDLSNIRSMTGKKITYNAENGTFSVRMPTMDPLYYRGWSEDPKTDLMTLAQGIRSKGYDKIIMNLSFDKEDVALKRAREAYEACILSGFPPDKIVLKVNGVEKKAEEVFSKDPRTLQALNAKSPAIIAELDALLKVPAPQADRVKRIKSEIQGMKTADADKTKETTMEQEEQAQPPQLGG